MNILPIIQARMNSTRLPGKIVKPFSNGMNTLDFILDALSSPDLEPAVIATTLNSSDDFLVDLFKTKARMFRGSEINVLERFATIIQQYNPDYIVRICADNPFLFKEGVQFLINQISKYPNADYLSFQIWQTPAMKVPLGIFAEVVKASALLDKFKAPNALDTEHVTINLYQTNNSKDVLFDFEENFFSIPKGMRFTVDTPEDFEHINTIISHFDIKSSVDKNLLKKIIQFTSESHLLEEMVIEGDKSINSKNYSLKKDQL